ncbi:MAG: DUF5320 domain-containing protein [Holophaga sp.]|nr:DUF5320 domain-containing protein [Holophaga sp.]
MPRLNGTGPMGMGAMTGRAQGRCTGTALSEEMTSGRSCGMGQGRGSGGGRRGIHAGGRALAMRSDRQGQESSLLEAQLKALQERLAKLEAERGDM